MIVSGLMISREMIKSKGCLMDSTTAWAKKKLGTDPTRSSPGNPVPDAVEKLKNQNLKIRATNRCNLNVDSRKNIVYRCTLDLRK